MSLKHLRPFQVDPSRVDKQEIKEFVDKISTSSKVSEIQEIFDSNISICAYMLKNGYIEYRDIYFLSTSLIVDENNRPDYLCGCYHPKTGINWYAIICAGPQEKTWDDDLNLTIVGKKSFDKLNYSINNLGEILMRNRLSQSIEVDRIHGLLIIGQDREFFRNKAKQARKREVNQTSPVKIRTYGAFLRRFGPKNKFGKLDDLVGKVIGIFQAKT